MQTEAHAERNRALPCMFILLVRCVTNANGPSISAEAVLFVVIVLRDLCCLAVFALAACFFLGLAVTYSPTS